MAMLARADIEQIGFADVGEDVFISDRATFHGAARIRLGSHVRIDDFCVLSAGQGGISIGNYVHIGVGSTLLGSGAIVMEDFSGLSSRVSIYSSSDDYSGSAMTNPTVPAEFTAVKSADVFLAKHVIVGAGSVILPGALLEIGTAIGALSVIRSRCEQFGIYHGNPARRVGERKRDILAVEASFRARQESA